MPVLLEGIDIREVGVYEIRQTLNVQVTAEQARRTVNRWLLDHVSDVMRAEAPTLVVNGRSVWRVPAVLTAVHVGLVGIVGMVDVDAVTGDLIDAERSSEELIAKGIQLAQTIPPYPGPRSVPDEFIPRNVPSAAILQLPEDE